MNDIRKIVEQVKLPKTNMYYEKDSADGYAFLGYARAKLGLDYEFCYEAAKERKFTLGAAQKIRGFSVTGKNMYTYTIWACIDFLNYTHKKEDINQLMKVVDRIGNYPFGAFRYSTEEFYLMVPNVTTAAVLMYSMGKQEEKALELLDVMEKTQQKDGNWYYKEINEYLSVKRLGKKEDCYHMAMIICQLIDAKEYLCSPAIDPIIERAVGFLKQSGDRCHLCNGLDGWLCPGTVGWGVPMLYRAIRRFDEGLREITLEKTKAYCIGHSNFRTRAISAWALTRDL